MSHSSHSLKPRPPLEQNMNISNKSYVVTWLLSLLLGTFGVDRFYLGRTGTGILKLLSFGGLGIWSFIDWICVTLGVVRDKQGRILSGFSMHRRVIQAISILLILLSLGVGIWQSIYTNPHISKHYASRKSIEGGLIEQKLELVRLSFNYPKTWKVTSQGASKISKTQDFFLEAPDGFKLGFIIADSSFYPNDAANKANTSFAETVLSSNEVGSGIVNSKGAAGKLFTGVTVARGNIKVGDTYSTANQDLPTNPAVPGLFISINGGYNDGFKTLTDLTEQQSIKDAVLILQSLKYY